jgi:hypothetical protein
VEPFLLPLTLDFPSIVEARKAIIKVAEHKDVPAHSVTIRSEDGTVFERWFQIDGVWRRRA